MYALENIKKKCKPNEYEAFVAVGYTNLNSLREEKFQFLKEWVTNLLIILAQNLLL